MSAPRRTQTSNESEKPSLDPLSKYWEKRDFGITAEPRGERAPSGSSLSFVIQKHDATRLHYDFRLELDGVLVSWAVPKGPSFDPADKRMAIHVEDHPLSYGSFEGTIPPKQYGAGTVIVWDNGTWEPVGDPHAGLAAGKLQFRLNGQKLTGLWELIKIAKGGERQEPWLLFKKKDEFARPRKDYDVVMALPDSVIRKPIASSRAKKTRRKAQSAAPADGSADGAETSTASKTSVPGAIEAALPDSLGPQLATLATGVPAAGRWIYEIKFDGYRIMARFERGKVKLITRGGHDWSAKMPGLVADLEKLQVGSGILDGEIVVLGENGAPNFNALQKAFDHPRSSANVDYFVFDVPFFEGYDLRRTPLADRRQLLKAFLAAKATGHVRFSADFEADAASILGSACQMGLEGVIAKRADAPYVSTRSDTWLKLKCKQRQEFVVAGYTDRSDGSAQVGSLLLGVYSDAGELLSAGSVGTGWSAQEAAELKRTVSKFASAESPFAAGPSKPGRWSKRVSGSERWLKPELVAEVEFAEWTPDAVVRHASFVGLRADKRPETIRREVAKSPQAVSEPAAAKPAAAKGAVAKGAVANGAVAKAARTRAPATATKVSNPDRVIDASTGLKKLDLVRYYESVADWILPHLAGRPCSLVRGPTGVGGELFFQKHGERIGIPGIKELDAELWPGHSALLEVDSVQALAGCAQMNVIEFHTWNSKSRKIDTPDRIIFDLDPGEGTEWSHVQEAATLVRSLLSDLSLESWLKTSGGKGLHVVLPIATRLDYDTVKSFSGAVVQHLAKVIPSRFVAKSGGANRVGKIFVDYLRNGHGATTAAAFSARARPGLGVSMPVSWDELAELKGGAQWNITNAREHLSFQTEDPWAAYAKCKQTLTAAMKALGFEVRQR